MRRLNAVKNDEAVHSADLTFLRFAAQRFRGDRIQEYSNV